MDMHGADKEATDTARSVSRAREIPGVEGLQPPVYLCSMSHAPKLLVELIVNRPRPQGATG
jgi:hypothetical protein